jgi:hypothetical protein
MMEEQWGIAFHEKPRARGIPFHGTFSTRREAERKQEILQAKRTNAEKVQGAHFSLIPPSRPESLSKAVFKRKEPGLGAKQSTRK